MIEKAFWFCTGCNMALLFVAIIFWLRYEWITVITKD
jgi:hypothetical protein